MKCSELHAASTTLPALREVLPGLPEDGAGPVFKEPWQAQAFAMTLALHERGVFTWTEWAATLTQAIRDAQAAGDPDTGENYYRHWMVALERISTEKALVHDAMLARRKAEWLHAARHTAHGKPIQLKRA
jgi:nitrile hydratase accessory protein